MQKRLDILLIILYLASLILVGSVFYTLGDKCKSIDISQLSEQLDDLKQQQDFSQINMVMDSIQSIVTSTEDIDRKRAKLNLYLKTLEQEHSAEVANYSVYSKLVRGYIEAEKIALEEPAVEDTFQKAKEDKEKAEKKTKEAQESLAACCPTSLP